MQSLRLRLASFLIAFPVLVAVASAADWPQWRGPLRDGKSEETGLLKQWPEGGPKLLWSTPGLGGGYSSVAVADERVYSMGSANGKQGVVCVNAKTGKPLWATPLESGGNPNSTPTVDGGLVYALSTEGELVCLDAKNGRLKWRTHFARDFGGRMMSGWGYSESPLIDGDHLICTPGADDAVIAALDKKTGKVIWKAPAPDMGGAAYASVVISNACGVKQYITLTGRGILGVAAEDGSLLWKYNRIANGTANIPTPIVDGDFVFCSSGYGTGTALLKLTKSGENEITCEEQYFLGGDEAQNHHGGMIQVGEHVYFGHGHNEGHPICIEMESGNIEWSEGGAGEGSAAVVFADGLLYFRYQNGVVALVEANPSEYVVKGQFTIPDSRGKGDSWPHPVIANGRLYLRDADRLFCYDVKGK